MARWLKEVAPQAEIASRCDTILCLLYSAQSSFGLAMLPCHIGDPEPGLVPVIDPLPALTVPLWILSHRDLHRTPKVRAFFDYLTVEIEKYKPLLLGRTRPLRSDADSGEPSTLATS